MPSATMSMATVALLMGTIIALLTALVTVYKARAERKAAESVASKETADGESILVQTAMALLAPLKERIATLEEQNEQMAKRLAKLEREVAHEAGG